MRFRLHWNLAPRSVSPFIIAQRITSVLHADQILVLDRGRIAERGRHHELLMNSQIYREIYASQLGDVAGENGAGVHHV